MNLFHLVQLLNNINPNIIQKQRQVNQAATHNDAVLLFGLHPDCSDVTYVYAAQRAKEAGLTILMTGQQLPVCHHQATWDTRRGGDTLGDDLQEKLLQVRDCLHRAGIRHRDRTALTPLETD